MYDVVGPGHPEVGQTSKAKPNEYRAKGQPPNTRGVGHLDLDGRVEFLMVGTRDHT